MSPDSDSISAGFNLTELSVPFSFTCGFSFVELQMLSWWLDISVGVGCVVLGQAGQAAVGTEPIPPCSPGPLCEVPVCPHRVTCKRDRIGGMKHLP